MYLFFNSYIWCRNNSCLYCIRTFSFSPNSRMFVFFFALVSRSRSRAAVRFALRRPSLDFRRRACRLDSEFSIFDAKRADRFVVFLSVRRNSTANRLAQRNKIHRVITDRLLLHFD